MNLHLCIAKSFADRKQKKGGKREEKEKERESLLPVSTIRGIKGVPIARVLIKDE